MKPASILTYSFLLSVICVAVSTDVDAQSCIGLGGSNPTSHSQNFNGLGSSPAPQFTDSANVFVLNPSGPRRYLGKFDNAIADNGGTVNVPGWAIVEEGTNSSSVTGRYAAGNGSGGGANAYSFGSDSDRALGSINDDSMAIVYVGGCFTNTSLGAINSVEIAFSGEMWRRGASGAQTDRLDFEYAVNATNLYSGSYTPADAFDFVTPNTSGGAGARNGNDPAYRTVFPTATLNVTVAPGESLYIRWVDTNIAGADDGLAIDDFAISFFIPSSSPVEIAGRVTDSRLRGVGNVRLELQGPNGETWITITNPFGHYRFTGIPSGETYLVTASGKGLVFAEPSRIIDAGENLDDVDFQTLPDSKRVRF